MAFLRSMDISGSALTAQRYRMDVIAENLANISTTRTEDGGPYMRRYVVFQSRGRSFGDYLDDAMYGTGDERTWIGGNGVRVTHVGIDPDPGKIEYDPTHPDADADGYVEYPNVELVTEMTDMLGANRAYEANVTALNSFKNMANKALEIGRG